MTKEALDHDVHGRVLLEVYGSMVEL